MSGANLQGANLGAANLNVVQSDAIITGQDAKRNPIYDKYWTPDTDMTRYTDPNHPDFWQPGWAKDQG